MSQLADNGLVHLKSNHSVVETVARLEALLQTKSLPILAQIDHSGNEFVDQFIHGRATGPIKMEVKA